ncbi:MAG: sensor histidine kinase [Acetatifactor sp.]|nr:sensor histidine kinase [Acetatifactor sp.]
MSERMKSERLKTELITNVSHDLKTPLTSIINYAELISREAAENPEESQTMREYSEVLLRQSGRLKRLLENLVEASKAATGNLEVNLESCEAGVLLSQAVGEYQQRMEEKALELRVSQPEEPVRILADGRHLWRVFDNLLNNICKYAQENSRVYLTLEQKENKAFIIFRNMSKYALDISPEELEERFVRGDKSRHMEGNGLGLSIAKSLTELQQGQMEIVVDGDLFKVILIFDIMD